MKREHSAPCGHNARPGNATASHCLPFCGLGAEQHIKNKAARCGTVLSEQARPSQATAEDVLTGS